MMMKILNRLREETAELHRELEGDNLANKIIDHTINLDEYRTLLAQNYIAYKNAETEILKYLPEMSTEKSDRLKNDLQGLGFNDLSTELNFSCSSKAEAIGAAYVVEGSAMGGMVIGRELEHCPALRELPSQQFFNGDRSNVRNWNEFLKYLRSQEFTDAEIELAAAKARDTFLLFREAFKIQFASST